MTYTQHGYHIPGSITSDEYPIGRLSRPKLARCGGPNLCGECRLECQSLTETQPLLTWRFQVYGRDVMIKAESMTMAMAKFLDQYKGGPEIDEMIITKLAD